MGERESQWLSEKRMFALPTAISGIRWKGGIFSAPYQGKKSEGVRGKEVFPSRKSLDSEIGLFLRQMLEFLVMILLQSMSEWEKVLCCTAQSADRLHPNYINNAKLKYRKRDFQRCNIRLLLSNMSVFQKICIPCFITHVQLLDYFFLLIEGKFLFC